jgi:purine-cytosine permease-like protein
METGRSEAASVLSFAASVFAFAARWATHAADYTCYQPTTTSRRLVFLSTYLGLLFPLLFTQMLGAALVTAAETSPLYGYAYQKDKVGGLLAEVLFTKSGLFGRFCTVLLALSVVANNCPNVYSLALSMQMLAGWTAKVPRAVWTLLVTVLYIKLAIFGFSHFERLLEVMLSLIVSCLLSSLRFW